LHSDWLQMTRFLVVGQIAQYYLFFNATNECKKFIPSLPLIIFYYKLLILFAFEVKGGGNELKGGKVNNLSR